MLNSAAIALPLRVSEIHRDPRGVNDAGPKLVQFLNRVHDQNANPASLLNRYIEGWAQTDLERILDGTAPSYRFTDPFVGSFDGRSLHKYFDLSCRIDSSVQERSVGASSLSSCKAQ